MVDMGEGHEVARLPERLALLVDDFLTILDAAMLLGFAEVRDGRVNVTPIGRDFATTTILRLKDLFRQQVLERVPIAATIAKTLAEKENKSMRAHFFLDLLDEFYHEAEARQQFNTAVEWGPLRRAFRL